MSGPFATYFGNQRTIAVPVSPSVTTTNNFTGAGTTTVATLTLGTNSPPGSPAVLYLYYAIAASRLTGAASGASFSIQWQFQNAAHAAVGGAAGVIVLSAACGGATATLSPAVFVPSFPQHYSLIVPATAVEVALQVAVFGVIGAPSIDVALGAGLDTLNQGSTGDIGGAGIVAQASTNPNAF